MNFREWVDFLCIIPKFWKLLKRHPHLRVNAHNHTDISDGEMGPGKLLFWNWICGFREVWITDHNVIWDERLFQNRLLVWFAKSILNVEIVAGVEASGIEDLSGFGGSEKHVVHYIVGRFKIDPESLREILMPLQIEIDKGMKAVVEEVKNKGFKIVSYECLKKKYKNVTLEIIAKNIHCEKGSNSTPPSVKELKDVWKRYVPNDCLPRVKDIASSAEEAGGEKILPHPRFTMGDEIFKYYLKDVLTLLKGYGTQKVETHTKKQSRENMREIERCCFQLEMGISRGADIHDIGDFRDYMKNMFEVYA